MCKTSEQHHIQTEMTCGTGLESIHAVPQKVRKQEKANAKVQTMDELNTKKRGNKEKQYPRQ